jgi:hypothetical protein
MSDLMGRIATAVWGEAGDRHSITILETVFAELDLAGYVIVPKEPSERMVGEGARELADQGLCEVEDSDAYACFKAMLSAAPKVAG